MRHPHDKFIRIELISLAFVVLIGLIALIQGFILILFLGFYLLALGLFCNALIESYSHRTVQAGKQLLRSILIIVFTTFLFFQL